VSSRRTRHKSVATARSSDLRFSPEARGGSRLPRRRLQEGHDVRRRRHHGPREGEGFPSVNLDTSCTGNGPPPDGPRATATEHCSPSTTPPSRPWHRPAPELLARPPTREAPTFPGPPPRRPNSSCCETEEDKHHLTRNMSCKPTAPVAATPYLETDWAKVPSICVPL
jgi:hypothetical protein